MTDDTTIGRFGPFFALETVSATTDSSTVAGWVPVTDLVTHPERLTGRVRATQVALGKYQTADLEGDAAWRVAASVTQLGVGARLIAVALALTVDGADLPLLERFVFQDKLGGPYPLAVTAATGAPAAPRAWPSVVLEWAGPVTRAAVARHGLSPRVAWGNVASAVAGAAKMIAAADRTAGERAQVLAGQALGLPELAGTGSADADGAYRRRSCCLIYRLYDDPMFCVDCVLAARTTT